MKREGERGKKRRRERKKEKERERERQKEENVFCRLRAGIHFELDREICLLVHNGFTNEGLVNVVVHEITVEINFTTVLCNLSDCLGLKNGYRRRKSILPDFRTNI